MRLLTLCAGFIYPLFDDCHRSRGLVVLVTFERSMVSFGEVGSARFYRLVERVDTERCPRADFIFSRHIDNDR